MQSAKHIAIIGAGPSGLMAAEILAKAGHAVTLYDQMPTAGRKFLMAGRGGLNLTHSEPLEDFLPRYGAAADWLSPYIRAFSPADLRSWCEGLGVELFTGSSGRVFPREMKAAPLLRAWLRRLETLGVNHAMRHRWQGWDKGALLFQDAAGQTLRVKPDATLLALGGASWPRLGSDGTWAGILSRENIPLSTLRPANSGFIVPWSAHFSARFAGQPLKPIRITHHNISRQGEAMITAGGLEGGVIYALSCPIRQTLEVQGPATLQLDLRPDMPQAALAQKLAAPRGSKSLSHHLRGAKFSPQAIGLLRETTTPEQLANLSPAALAARLKALPVTVTATADIARAISTTGGILQTAVTAQLMLQQKPGVFVAGEMLDWEAPTGGYLLQGCFSTAVAAAGGILQFLTYE